MNVDITSDNVAIGTTNYKLVYTMLIFSLQPLLVYFASLFFLKEPFHWKKFVAFIVVLASIAAAQIMT